MLMNFMLYLSSVKHYTYDPCKYTPIFKEVTYVNDINIELSRLYCSIFIPYDITTKIPHLLTVSLKKFEKTNILQDIVENVYRVQYFIDFQEKVKQVLYKVRELSFSHHSEVIMINEALKHLDTSTLTEKIDITHTILNVLDSRVTRNTINTRQVIDKEIKLSIQETHNSSAVIVMHNNKIAPFLKALSEKFIIKKVILNKHNINHQQILNDLHSLSEHQDELRNDIIRLLHEQSPTMPEFLYLTMDENLEYHL
ncbi:hypothetical protein [Candidatus Fokinia solitaria]|nr:hypothetical protein [Candidatus Fokinia solitaria]